MQGGWFCTPALSPVNRILWWIGFGDWMLRCSLDAQILMLRCSLEDFDERCWKRGTLKINSIILIINSINAADYLKQIDSPEKYMIP